MVLVKHRAGSKGQRAPTGYTEAHILSLVDISSKKRKCGPKYMQCCTTMFTSMETPWNSIPPTLQNCLKMKMIDTHLSLKDSPTWGLMRLMSANGVLNMGHRTLFVTYIHITTPCLPKPSLSPLSATRDRSNTSRCHLRRIRKPQTTTLCCPIYIYYKNIKQISHAVLMTNENPTIVLCSVEHKGKLKIQVS